MGDHYSFDYGNCHFTVLNSNWMGRPDSGDYDRISRWLREDLRQSRQLWKIVVFHHPPYPVAPDWRAEVLQEHWVPILEENGVDLVFVGHQHLYMRTKPLKDGRIQPEGEGIVYLMGNAGTKHYSFQSAADYVAVLLTRVQNYQIVELRGNSLTVTSKDWQGNVVDNFRLVKEAGGGNLSTGRWIRLVVCLIQLLRARSPQPGGMNKGVGRKNERQEKLFPCLDGFIILYSPAVLPAFGRMRRRGGSPCFPGRRGLAVDPGQRVEEPVRLSLEELKAMEEGLVEDDYFSINSYGTEQYFHFRGFGLASPAGKSETEGERLKVTFIAGDGYQVEYTLEEVQREIT